MRPDLDHDAFAASTDLYDVPQGSRDIFSVKLLSRGEMHSRRLVSFCSAPRSTCRSSRHSTWARRHRADPQVGPA